MIMWYLYTQPRTACMHWVDRKMLTSTPAITSHQRKRWNDENMRDDESEKRGKMMAVIKIPITIWPNDFFMLPSHQNGMNTRNAFLVREARKYPMGSGCVCGKYKAEGSTYFLSQIPPNCVVDFKWLQIQILIPHPRRSVRILTQHTLCLCVYLRQERSPTLRTVLTAAFLFKYKSR